MGLGLPDANPSFPATAAPLQHELYGMSLLVLVVEQCLAVAAAEHRLHGVLGMGHQAHHRLGLVEHAGDVAGAGDKIGNCFTADPDGVGPSCGALCSGGGVFCALGALFPLLRRCLR